MPVLALTPVVVFGQISVGFCWDYLGRFLREDFACRRIAAGAETVAVKVTVAIMVLLRFGTDPHVERFNQPVTIAFELLPLIDTRQTQVR